MQAQPKLRTAGLHVYYGDYHALKNVTTSIAERRLTALIGPSGCGKSTLLRVFNRMNDLIPGCRIEGTVELDGQPLYAPRTDTEALRRRVGIVFQRPNPFPLSIRENVVYGRKLHGAARARELDALTERCLRAVGLWDDLKIACKKARSASAPSRCSACASRARSRSSPRSC